MVRKKRGSTKNNFVTRKEFDQHAAKTVKDLDRIQKTLQETGKIISDTNDEVNPILDMLQSIEAQFIYLASMNKVKEERAKRRSKVIKYLLVIMVSLLLIVTFIFIFFS